MITKEEFEEMYAEIEKKIAEKLAVFFEKNFPTQFGYDSRTGVTTGESDFRHCYNDHMTEKQKTCELACAAFLLREAGYKVEKNAST